MDKAITLTTKEYDDALQKIEQASTDTAYTQQFSFEFPDGLNTASVMEICRAVQNSGFDDKVRLARICVAGKNVKCRCPNGETEQFQLSGQDDGFDGIPLFAKEPFALMALADCIYGHILKKSMRLSQPKEKPAAEA